MAKMRIKKNDTVMVITGRSQANGGDRGKTGKVIEVLKDEQRVLVEGINRVTKHTKVGQTDRGSSTGGITVVEAPIHVSNVIVVDPDTKKPAHVRISSETKTVDGKTKTVRTRTFEPRKNYADAKGAAKKPAKKAATKKDEK